MAMDLLKFAHEVKWRDMSLSVCTGWLRSLSLPQHLLLLALTPLPFLLAAFFMVHEVEPKASHEPARLARGVAAVRLLATAVEAGVYFRRPQQLEQIVDALGDADNVTALAIYDHSGRPLVERGRAAVATRERVRAVRTASFIDERGGRMAFAAPVMSMPAARDDGIGDALFTLVEPQAAGWVLLEFDAAAPVSADDQLFLRHALLALAGSIYVALRLGHAWGGPMLRVADAVKRVRAGQWDVRLPVDAVGREVQQLNEGINALIGTLEGTRRAVQAGVDEARDRFAYQAMHDHLTGLPNRRAFDKALEEAVSASRRASDRCVLCFIDLDFFKTVNDIGGHAAGDALLREVAGLIQQGVRTEDLTSRIGGDEFALLLRNCSTDDACRIVDSLCRAISALRFQWEGREFRVSASFGLAEIDASVDSSAAALKIADDACYAAKREGRNQVVLRQPGSQGRLA
ncbi:MAG: diguanylate cyclase [Burkholderiaceae bacterium]|nr:MAG: diguanylate cyclase [Burkholderiaceae bacterium]